MSLHIMCGLSFCEQALNAHSAHDLHPLAGLPHLRAINIKNRFCYYKNYSVSFVHSVFRHTNSNQKTNYAKHVFYVYGPCGKIPQRVMICLSAGVGSSLT